MSHRRSGALACIVLALAVSSTACSHDDESAVMPSVELTSIEREGSDPMTVQADAIEGPALINLWATWCGPCRAEMPAFQTVADSARGAVTILGINEGEDAAAATAFLDDVDVTFGQFLDPDGAIIDRLRVVGLPATIVLNADGDIVSVHSGALDEDGIRELVDAATG
jgi:cytochrome c biogenesis protein CcmG/thiol:disulfide interchange protein DsbE